MPSCATKEEKLKITEEKDENCKKFGTILKKRTPKNIIIKSNYLTTVTQ